MTTVPSSPPWDDGLDEPLVPSAPAPAALDQIKSLLIDAGVTAQMLDLPDRARTQRRLRGDSTLVLGDDVGRQIRSILIGAGVTAQMMDLPGEAPREPLPPVTADYTPREAPPTEAATSTTSAETDADDVMGSLMLTLNAMSDSTKCWLRECAVSRRALLGDKTSEHLIARDVYNMFFLSKNWSTPFFYTIYTVLTKFTMYAILLYWIYMPDGFREKQLAREDAPAVVHAMQLLLIPVSIGITEELMLTMDVLSEMRWAPIPGRPHATQRRYGVVNVARLLDGLVWLIITMSLMLYAVDILEMFLNFAALQFLQSIDNIAFDMARGGYLSMEVEKVALDVTRTTLPSLRATWREYADVILLLLLLLFLVILWALVNYVWS